MPKISHHLWNVQDNVNKMVTMLISIKNVKKKDSTSLHSATVFLQLTQEQEPFPQFLNWFMIKKKNKQT